MEDSTVQKVTFAAAFVAAALAGTSLAWAHHQHSIAQFNSEGDFGWFGDDFGFSAATLNGTYILEGHGSVTNGTSPGEVTVLGTLTFDGVSVVGGNLVVTIAAGGGQFSCTDTFTTGSYTITTSTSAPGLGTMTLPGTAGSFNFALLVPRAAGVTADVIESDNGGFVAGSMLCGATPASMAFTGHLRAVPSGNFF
jgi:hypothetical protein